MDPVWHPCDVRCEGIWSPLSVLQTALRGSTGWAALRPVTAPALPVTRWRASASVWTGPWEGAVRRVSSWKGLRWNHACLSDWRQFHKHSIYSRVQTVIHIALTLAYAHAHIHTKKHALIHSFALTRSPSLSLSLSLSVVLLGLRG